MFAVLGDLFAIHMIDHPGRDSELAMIKKFGPTVPVKTLNQLLTIFNELREKTDQGLLQYPYSTRELVNIVRHCNVSLINISFLKKIKNIYLRNSQRIPYQKFVEMCLTLIHTVKTPLPQFMKYSRSTEYL